MDRNEKLDGMDRAETLISLLKTGSEYVRQDAAKVLGEMKDPRAIPALIGALDDTSYARFAAQLALFQIGVPAVPALVGRLNHANPTTRLLAAGALAEILGACDAGALAEFEKRFEEGARSSADSSTRANAGTAMPELVRFKNGIAKKRNELAAQRDVLLSDIPKPPKKGSVFQTTRRALANV
jgi:hypothetical protein